MSTRSKLLAMTGDLQLPPEEVAADPPTPEDPVAPPSTIVPPPAVPAPLAPAVPPVIPGAARTGPGRMLEIRGQILAAEGEVSRLRDKLKEHDGADATKLLDPTTIVPSQWANRHPDAFKSAEFERLKQDIAVAGGNVQPISVRAIAGSPGRYEIIFGHRRHRACQDLGLPVLATIRSEPLSEIDFFAAMDRENRERADLSPFEQGHMYRKALDAALYPSNRRLAEALGVSHTWVANVLAVADLPQPIVECFRSPIEIQHRHAKAIAAAMESDRKGVLRRAERIRLSEKKHAAGEVVAGLCRSSEASGPERAPITVGGRMVGSWTRDGKGRVLLQLEAGSASDDRVSAALQRLAESLT